MTDLQAWDSLAGTDPPPWAVAQGRELAERLRHGLALLPPRQGEAFCLVFLEGLTYAQAGKELGISANHVGVILHRARLKLRELLESVGVNDTK